MRACTTGRRSAPSPASPCRRRTGRRNGRRPQTRRWTSPRWRTTRRGPRPRPGSTTSTTPRRRKSSGCRRRRRRPPRPPAISGSGSSPRWSPWTPRPSSPGGPTVPRVRPQMRRRRAAVRRRGEVSRSRRSSSSRKKATFRTLSGRTSSSAPRPRHRVSRASWPDRWRTRPGLALPGRRCSTSYGRSPLMQSAYPGLSAGRTAAIDRERRRSGDGLAPG